MRAKLSRKTLDSSKARGAGEVWDVGDGACPGFYARHRGRPDSRWRYVLKYRLGRTGGTRKVRHHVIAEDGGAIPPEIGELQGLTPGATWTPEAARKEAERIRGLVRDGKDPDAGRGVPTLREFAARFMREHMTAPLRKHRTVKEYQKLLDRHFLKANDDHEPVGAELTEVRLDRIDQSAVTRLAQALKTHPVTANRLLAVLSSMYTRAAAWGVLPPGTNPVRGVPRFAEGRRERFLSNDELKRLGEALRQLEAEGAVSPFALAAIRLLLFTGARPSEVTGLCWPFVDLGRGLLNLPDSKTGTKVIYLSAPARKILANLPRIEGEPRVFPPHKRMASEADLESAWRRVRDRAGLTGVRLYDAVRHSFASIAVESGASLYLVGGLLGHRKVTTTQRYAHLSADPLHAAADAVGKRLTAAMRSKARPEPGKVTALRRARRGR